MSKRLTRLRSENVYGNLNSRIGAELHVVMEQGHTVFGSLEEISPNNIRVRDTRGHQHVILISNIYEVIFDLVVHS